MLSERENISGRYWHWFEILMRWGCVALVSAAMLFFAAVNGYTQTVPIPNFWDPNVRFVKPDLSTVPRIKFLTTTDFPPFNFVDRKKRLSGFNIDLAREICKELDVLIKCQIQALPWDQLQNALSNGEGDAIIAGLSISPNSREQYTFSKPYLNIPGRFITRRDAALSEPIYKSVFKKNIGVVQGSSHEAFFDKAFGERKFTSQPTKQAAFNALKAGTVDAVFIDAVSASFWLASENAADCCMFSGGPYLSEDFFGGGLAIATLKSNSDLVNGFNYALKQINDKGVFAELYLKYFPLGLY